MPFENAAFCEECMYNNNCDKEQICITKQLTRAIDSLMPSERKIIYSIMEIESVTSENFKIVAKKFNLDEFDIRQKVAKVKRQFMRSLEIMSEKEKITFIQPIISQTDNNPYARLIKLFQLLTNR